MLNVLQIPPAELFSLLAAIGFAAGLNLYATVAVLGLLARFGHLPLPPGLLLLAGWPVIAASTALFVIEFFADKIPAFDLIWNALDRKSTRLNSSHLGISYAVFCLKKKKQSNNRKDQKTQHPIMQWPSDKRCTL